MCDEKVSLSVIVPVFNTERYLLQCLNSLISQTLPQIELLLIDDGSTDASGRICDEFAEKYDFIKVFHQKNSGAAVARKRGMAEMKGKYFTVCDSDDFVAPDFYERLYEAAEKVGADIVQCGYTLYFSDAKMICVREEKIKSVIERYNGDCSKIMDVLLLSPPLTVRRIHRSSLVRQYDISFDEEIRNSEDHLFSAQFFLVCRKIAYVDQTGYFYRQLRDGRMTNVGDDRLLDFFIIFKKLREFIGKNSLSDTYAFSLLEINTLLYPVLRLEPAVKKDYCLKFLEILTMGYVLKYCFCSFVYCLKMRSVKYFLLNGVCCPLLILISLFRKLPFVASMLLTVVVFLRKGGFFVKHTR